MTHKPDLRDLIKLLYRQTEADIEDTADRILDQRKRAYRAMVEEQAALVGCTRRASAARPPSGGSLRELKRQSREDAESIAATWNRESEAQVEQLFEENRRGNRQYYYSNMEEWAERREVWKSRQIASMTVGVARDMARDDFMRFNSLGGGDALYQLTGPTPVCADCARLMAMGQVGQDVVDRNPMPLHVNCFHDWALVRPAGQPDCETLWVG